MGAARLLFDRRAVGVPCSGLRPSRWLWGSCSRSRGEQRAGVRCVVRAVRGKLQDMLAQHESCQQSANARSM